VIRISDFVITLYMDSDLSRQSFSHFPSWPPPVGVRLTVIPEHSCQYLPGRKTETRAFLAGRIPPAIYHAFMDAGFRRSGRMIYQPACPGCRACVPIRVLVNEFAPDKSQRRCLRRNQSLHVSVSTEPLATDEKYELYRRYLRDWHGRAEDESDEETRESFERFLYDSPVQTIEFAYRDAGSGRLLAVGICDICAASLSSVYCYFDPSQRRRGLGTYSVLREIDYARSKGIPCYYLGYWVSGCAAMEYKSGFGPHELLQGDGIWRRRSELPVIEKRDDNSRMDS
jgi:leucyl-tRNA---protein transferase